MRTTVLLSIALAGLALAILGLAAALDLVSLRSLAAEVALGRVAGAVRHLRELVGHAMAQRLELGAGLVGLAVLIASAKPLLIRGVGGR
jgi:hypothetical protein